MMNWIKNECELIQKYVVDDDVCIMKFIIEMHLSL